MKECSTRRENNSQHLISYYIKLCTHICKCILRETTVPRFLTHIDKLIF